MAERIEVGTLVNLDPTVIKVGRNSRWHGLKDEPINDLLQGIPVDGQLQPGAVWQDKQGGWHLEMGYRRLRAILEINGGRKEGEKIPYKAIVVDMPEPLEAFLRNVHENIDRENLSPVDKAHGQNILREEFKQKNVDIAKAYRETPANVSILACLLDVCKEVQAMVHVGLITTNEAVKMKREKWTPKEQKAFCEERAKECAAKVPGAKPKKPNKNKNSKKQDKASLKRMSEVIGALRLVTEFPGTNPSLRTFCKELVEWIATDLTSSDLITALTGKDKDEIEEMMAVDDAESDIDDDDDDDDDDN